MLNKIIQFSLLNKRLVLLLTSLIVLVGIYSLSNIPIGAVPDVTNNQVQVITTSTSLSTQDIEKFVTYPIELELANLPGVTEIRSISKFGISVITVVFEDAMGTYLPRQLIAEKLKSASEQIPRGFGTPEMGPITTGLGEIYQYTIDVDPVFKDRYSVMDLRTIQDWVVKRKLSGIPGVVEINTWGGYLKQYEIAIDTDQLNALEVNISDVFKALDQNNSIGGGSYIEKKNQSHFIRGEGLVESLEDIENIVIEVRNGTPLLIKNIAKVQFGSAPRYGAITANGEGEKVLGQVMMLKDSDSNRVIQAVKERIDEVASTLPPGVSIKPFLDRSDLIGRTTFTITENLLLGCLIVIFVVVLFLGNLRSGLVVASVIPLSLFFALTMMYIFNIDANLMSLGAIDFGIIIDGAVIIIEYVAFHIQRRSKEFVLLSTREEKDILREKITYEGSSKMMNSAIFGQFIILIVFIPILSLSGVEGKMFTPMALSFSFALIGAMLLCVTYVPAVSALFIQPDSKKFAISVKLIDILKSWYKPSLEWAIKFKRGILIASGLLLITAVLLFMRMGGEFLPTLDEGDFVIQPVIKTGTSLSKTIEITTDIERILLDEFPEVNQVVTRIGAAEVPTDPMSMEESDVIIQLKDRDEWVSADSKDELANKFKEALKVIPGLEVEFTQPIEMRFNELITGVRSDIAIKIFGTDLSELNRLGIAVKELIEDVDGASDVSLEKTVGLPQMNVKFNRQKLAQYGLSIEKVNDVIAMGFAGRISGQVFEGEKQFDIAVRFDNDHKDSFDDLKNLYINTPSGNRIPLEALAEVTQTFGAAKISRDDTQRRIVVGVNVRNRDLESVVEEIQGLVNQHIEFPVGYTVNYGGQFENLQSAKKRLSIAVPVALVLIFILLYFAFKSIKEVLIIYSAIPFAAVGGVFFLALRDLPFSISAGVGFIALFGIAVLNGIVMIEHFKSMRENSKLPMDKMVVEGALDRLRPVLLTAASAALGFIPMALSENSGAEVQRPLATVVIGGLVTSTLLTLIVLPILYSIFNKIKHK